MIRGGLALTVQLRGALLLLVYLLSVLLCQMSSPSMDVCLLEQDPEVASCGYRALADFPEAVHTINLLPEAVSHDLLSLYIPRRRSSLHITCSICSLSFQEFN